MPHDPEIFQNYWKPPFRYNPEASAVYDAKGNMVLDVRGWGFLTGRGSMALPQDKAMQIQDQLGIFLANVATLNWPK